MPPSTVARTRKAAVVAGERDLLCAHQENELLDKEEGLQGQDRDTDQVRDGGQRVEPAPLGLGRGLVRGLGSGRRLHLGAGRQCGRRRDAAQASETRDRSNRRCVSPTVSDAVGSGMGVVGG